MALSKEVKKLVNGARWKEAYELASNTVREDDSYLVGIDNKENPDKKGYLKGDADKYKLVSNAEDASTFEKSDATDVVRQLKKDDKNIKPFTVKRTDILQPVGSQGTEKGEVIELFIKSRYGKKNISSIKTVLVKLIEELGFEPTTNPFLSFLDIYLNKNGSITSEAMTLINDLYADGTLETLELEGKSRDKSEHVIFNKNLYTLNKEDVEFVVSAFSWLAEPSNLQRYMNNPDALTKYGVADKSKIDKNKANEIRNQILFETPTATENSAIRNASEIKNLAQELEIGGKASVDEPEDTQNVKINATVANKEKWAKIAKDNGLTPDAMNRKEIKDFITHLVKEFGLK